MVCASSSENAANHCVAASFVSLVSYYCQKSAVLRNLFDVAARSGGLDVFSSKLCEAGILKGSFLLETLSLDTLFYLGVETQTQTKFLTHASRSSRGPRVQNFSLQWPYAVASFFSPGLGLIAPELSSGYAA